MVSILVTEFLPISDPYSSTAFFPEYSLMSKVILKHHFDVF